MHHAYPILLSTLFCFASAKADEHQFCSNPIASSTAATAAPHSGWVVLVRGEKIAAVGPADEVKVPEGREGHRTARHHALARPYRRALAPAPAPLRRNEVGRSGAEGTARGTHLPRDEPRQGRPAAAASPRSATWAPRAAGYADVGIKSAIEKGIIPGPRLLVATKAIVATGSYAPRAFAPEWRVPQGADEADGENLRKVVREQIRGGADWIKVYADTPHGPAPGAKPAFSLDELKLIVSTAKDAGVPVVAHAQSKEGMRRAALAGVETIEHGDAGDIEVFRLMAKHNVGFCPTLAAGEAYARYFGGWQPMQPETKELQVEARQLQGSARSGRDHRQRQRHRRIRARRRRSRTGTARRLRDDAGAGPPRRDGRRRARRCTWRTRSER